MVIDYYRDIDATYERGIRNVIHQQTTRMHDLISTAIDEILGPDRLIFLTIDTDDGYAINHAITHHKPYDPRCRVCVLNKMRPRGHYKQSLVKCGEIACDLLKLHLGDLYVMIAAHRAYPRVTETVTLRNKDAKTLRPALIKSLTECNIDGEHL